MPQLLYKTKAGRYHCQNHEECEDVLDFCETEQFLVSVAADGATGCRFGREGAQAACAAALDFVRLEEERIFDYPEKKLGYLLVEHILYFIEKDLQDSVHEYGSTLLLSVIRKSDGRTLIAKLGNGKIFVLKKNGDILDPFERQQGANACLTTTEKSYRAFHACYTTLEDEEATLLCTDGLLGLLIHHFKLPSKTALALLDMQQLTALVDASDESDDIGFITVQRTV